MTTPQPTKKTLRVKLAKRHGWRCWWCGQRTREELGFQNSASIEHVVPRSCDGPNEYWNKVSACARCNFVRGIEPAEDFAMRAKNFSEDRRLTTDALNSYRKAKRRERCEQILAERHPQPVYKRITVVTTMLMLSVTVFAHRMSLV